MPMIAYICKTYKEINKGYEEIQNPDYFVLGATLTDTGKYKLFTEPRKMLQYIKEEIKKNSKNNKNTYIYSYDAETQFITLNQRNIIENYLYIRSNPLIAKPKDHHGFVDRRVLYLDIKNAIFNQQFEELIKQHHPTYKPAPEKIKTIFQLHLPIYQEVHTIISSLKELQQTLAEINIKPKKLVTAGGIAITGILSYIKKHGIAWTLMESDQQKGFTGKVWSCKWEKTIRSGNRGARNEAFKLGKFENTTLIDINSLYPHVMSEMMMPNYQTNKQKLHKPPFNWTKIKNYTGFLHCTIKTPKKGLGFLPIRIGKIQISPVNTKLTGVYTIEEIKYAETLGYKLENINWIISYPYCRINPFKSYMKKLHEIKRKLPKNRQKYIKLIMNNIYSKFSQINTMKEYKVIKFYDFEKWQEQGWKIETKQGQKLIISLTKGLKKPRYYNPAITVKTVAEARIKHDKELRKIPLSDLLYCDNDNICFIRNHLNKFDIGNNMGQFKIEEQNKKAEIFGEKTYRVNKLLKISGLPKELHSAQHFKEGKKITMQKKYTLKRTLQTGQFQRLGTLETQQRIMKHGKKYQGIIPEHIIETYTWQDPTSPDYEPEIMEIHNQTLKMIKKGEATIK